MISIVSNATRGNYGKLLKHSKFPGMLNGQVAVVSLLNHMGLSNATTAT